jgi:hypothetical protein
MLTFADEELRNKLAQKVHDRYKYTQVPLVPRSRGECEERGRQDKVNPSLPKNTAVYGFVCDIRQESLEELSEIYKTKKD